MPDILTYLDSLIATKLYLLSSSAIPLFLAITLKAHEHASRSIRMLMIALIASCSVCVATNYFMYDDLAGARGYISEIAINDAVGGHFLEFRDIGGTQVPIFADLGPESEVTLLDGQSVNFLQYLAGEIIRSGDGFIGILANICYMLSYIFLFVLLILVARHHPAERVSERAK